VTTGRIAAALLAALLVAATFFAGNAQAQDKPASPDASITARVESVLAKDPVLAGMDIKVETQSGVVSLSGFVRSVRDIAKAGDLARAVSGVSGVRNGLRVANRPDRA
jgi:hyperosmotically inducible protein